MSRRTVICRGCHRPYQLKRDQPLPLPHWCWCDRCYSITHDQRFEWAMDEKWRGGAVLKKPPIAELQRAFDEAVAVERRAIDAVPETPPRHEPSPRAKMLADRAWAAAERTNKARAALTAALDEEES